MPSTEAPNWWADVQQEREDLAGPGRRPADDWLGEDIDFVPRRRMKRQAPVSDRATAARVRDGEGAGHPLHGVFIPTAADAPTGRTIELTMADDVVAPEAPADVAH